MMPRSRLRKGNETFAKKIEENSINSTVPLSHKEVFVTGKPRPLQTKSQVELNNRTH